MLSYSQDIQQQQQLSHQIHQQQSSTIRLRDVSANSNPIQRNPRKRKSSPDNSDVSVLPPLIPHMQQPIPHGFQYAPSDYTPGGIPAQPHPHEGHSSQSPPANAGAGRPLSSSKRAEQNRKAQRAFRERRDQHVKQLESRSQLLDAALASADEANRRWEECRAIVEQLRIENTALRAALGQTQMLPPGSANGPGRAALSGNNHGAHQEEMCGLEGSNEFKNDSGEAKSDCQ
jgi:hypothetical protein